MDLLFFINQDIIKMPDVLGLTETQIMDKILEALHPYAIFYNEQRNRWETTVPEWSRKDRGF